jgi:tRNA pseudouridine38-40 synthase
LAESTSSSSDRAGEAGLRTIKLVVEYDGSDLAGWQRQDNGPSVQQHLEDAIAEMIGERADVTGGSRTDAGVHALGQVACFRTRSEIPLHGFRRGLNSKLPPSIAVVAIEEMPADFHPRFAARGKLYRYQILCRPDRSPILRNFAWHWPTPLDVAAMRAAAPALIGEHDFSAFRAAGCQARTATRRITDISLAEPGDGRLVFEVRGNAFLRHMVRIVVGTLVEVGDGRIAPDALPDILASRDRERAGRTAPAHGLTLVQVFY